MVEYESMLMDITPINFLLPRNEIYLCFYMSSMSLILILKFFNRNKLTGNAHKTKSENYWDKTLGINGYIHNLNINQITEAPRSGRLG